MSYCEVKDLDGTCLFLGQQILVCEANAQAATSQDEVARWVAEGERIWATWQAVDALRG